MGRHCSSRPEEKQMTATRREAPRTGMARITLIGRALLAVCLPGDHTDRLARADHEDELVGNEQLRGSPEDQIRQAREKTRDRVRTQISGFRRALGFSLVVLATAVLAAVGLVHGLGSKPSPAVSRALAVASLFAFAWATLGRLGWAERSWSGFSVTERLDHAVFRALYWVGTLLGTVALL
jgi:hypothetical protein